MPLLLHVAQGVELCPRVGVAQRGLQLHAILLPQLHPLLLLLCKSRLHRLPQQPGPPPRAFRDVLEESIRHLPHRRRDPRHNRAQAPHLLLHVEHGAFAKLRQPRLVLRREVLQLLGDEAIARRCRRSCLPRDLSLPEVVEVARDQLQEQISLLFLDLVDRLLKRPLQLLRHLPRAEKLSIPRRLMRFTLRLGRSRLRLLPLASLLLLLGPEERLQLAQVLRLLHQLLKLLGDVGLRQQLGRDELDLGQLDIGLQALGVLHHLQNAPADGLEADEQAEGKRAALVLLLLLLLLQLDRLVALGEGHRHPSAQTLQLHQLPLYRLHPRLTHLDLLLLHQRAGANLLVHALEQLDVRLHVRDRALKLLQLLPSCLLVALQELLPVLDPLQLPLSSVRVQFVEVLAVCRDFLGVVETTFPSWTPELLEDQAAVQELLIHPLQPLQSLPSKRSQRLKPLPRRLQEARVLQLCQALVVRQLRGVSGL
mmetsp:Transcript_2256/g.5266  ORF Transcript_2256/g.5266 Transcript_2256/m.5266 type:complete len:481 (+) Transcript_2256:728-2170(+)